ncbi:MAG: hypothetical protein ACKVOO_07305 [Burkholderiaceae bacterium]
MSTIRSLTILILACLLSACAAPKLSPEQASAIKRVGVISLMPQEVKYRKIGITVFNNEFKSLPTDDVFNTTARATIERYLRRTGKYQVTQIQVDVPGMAKRLNASSLVMSHNIERINTEVIELAKKNGVDAVIVVAENFDSERGIFGLAMSMRAGFNDIRSSAAMAGLQMFGVTAQKETFMARYPAVGIGTQVSRPDGNPWVYKLEDNLDAATHQQVVNVLQQTIERDLLNLMGTSGL